VGPVLVRAARDELMKSYFGEAHTKRKAFTRSVKIAREVD
jgi:hypothetical protein